MMTTNMHKQLRKYVDLIKGEKEKCSSVVGELGIGPSMVRLEIGH